MLKEEQHSDVISNIMLRKGHRRFAEIGVWEGWMTERVLSNRAGRRLSEYWAVDYWNLLKAAYWRNWRYIDMHEWDRKHSLVCAMMMRFPQLKVVRLASVKAAEIFPNAYFDMVYIDADHSYNAVQGDIKAWLPKVKKGGYLAGHDYLHRDGTGRRSLCEVKPAVDDYFGNSVDILPFDVWVKKV